MEQHKHHNDEIGLEHDEVWELLGKAKRPQPDIRFTQDVLRLARLESTRKRRWFESLQLLPLPRIAQVLALASITVCVWWASNSTPLGDYEDAFQQIALLEQNAKPSAEVASEDFELISDLDLLLASEENQLWLPDSSPY